MRLYWTTLNRGGVRQPGSIGSTGFRVPGSSSFRVNRVPDKEDNTELFEVKGTVYKADYSQSRLSCGQFQLRTLFLLPEGVMGASNALVAKYGVPPKPCFVWLIVLLHLHVMRKRACCSRRVPPSKRAANKPCSSLILFRKNVNVVFATT